MNFNCFKFCEFFRKKSKLFPHFLEFRSNANYMLYCHLHNRSLFKKDDIITPYFCNSVLQGFSTFWYSRNPKSMLYPYEYPQIKIWYKLYPLDKKLQKKRQFLVYFKYMKDLGMGSIELIFKLLAFKKLFAYPQWTLGVPPGVRVPQIENRCCITF